MIRIYEDEPNADHSVIHLMMNSQCTNRCADCCNNQYDLNTVPVVTVEELKAAKGGTADWWRAFPDSRLTLFCNEFTQAV